MRGEFLMYGSGPASDDTRLSFEGNGLVQPSHRNIGSAATGGSGNPIQDVVVAWFYLESVSPGVAGALAAQAMQGITFIVWKMTKWFRSGESPTPPSVGNKIVIGLGAVGDPKRRDIEISLGPDYSAEDIATILRSALSDGDDRAC